MSKQPVWKSVARLGDVNPIEHGGTFVYEDSTGVYPPEAEIVFPPVDGGRIKTKGNNMTIKSKINLINTAAQKLCWAFSSNHVNWGERLIDECAKEERGHRKWGPDFRSHHTADTISVMQAAKLFAVKRVAEYLTDAKPLQPRDYLHCQKSCFTAAGMADEFRAEIMAAWDGLPLAELAALDYSEFVNVRQQKAA